MGFCFAHNNLLAFIFKLKEAIITDTKHSQYLFILWSLEVSAFWALFGLFPFTGPYIDNTI